MRRMNFSGGEQVEDMLTKIIEKAQAVGTLKVGFLEGSTYPDGQGVAEVAAYNEFGTENMPARPFFRSMIAEKSGNWGKSLGNIAKATNYDVARTLALMGEGIGSQLQQSIVKYNAVPLADSTVARKGFAKQLIDTATMVNSVGYEVNDGEKHILPSAAQGGGK